MLHSWKPAASAPQTRPLRTLLAALFAGLLALLVILAAQWNLGRSARFVGVPQDSSVTLSRALKEVQATRGRSLPSAIAQADRVAMLNPLDARPYFLHAFGALNTGAEERGFALLETSRRRNPRLRETRILLFESFGRTGRTDEALDEVKTLVELMPSDRAILVRLMAGLVQRGEGLDLIAKALPRSPIKGEIMLRLASQGADIALLKRLAAGMRGAARTETNAIWIGPLVETVARRPDLAGAAGLWAGFHDTGRAAVGKRVFDPEFGATGTPPFGWKIGPTIAGVAEIREGALEVYYFGRRQDSLVTQMLLLDPGAYALRSAAKSGDAEAPRGLVWQVRCMVGGEILAQARLDRIIVAPTTPIRFVVPSQGCDAQYLELAGRPSDPPRRQSATIASVHIVKAAP